MTVGTEKQTGSRKESLLNLYLSPLQGSAEGPSQLLCLPKGLDTLAQLAPLTTAWSSAKTM